MSHQTNAQDVVAMFSEHKIFAVRDTFPGNVERTFASKEKYTSSRVTEPVKALIVEPLIHS
jgi:hypothetical protein